ncbi:hypothetical protein H4R34_000760 [Dimargaris verticillata]|uniref:JmjC domain-containing protein n=1 Tax=Dimargaris verticillata TaxID=2761393 RepID=A0A9W8BC22_9FUNG|nr:hypothetical protein H4R34_000760 [Dimargaris verticillata]
MMNIESLLMQVLSTPQHGPTPPFMGSEPPSPEMSPVDADWDPFAAPSSPPILTAEHEAILRQACRAGLGDPADGRSQQWLCQLIGCAPTDIARIYDQLKTSAVPRSVQPAAGAPTTNGKGPAIRQKTLPYQPFVPPPPIDPIEAQRRNARFWDSRPVPKHKKQTGYEYLVPCTVVPVQFTAKPGKELVVQTASCLSSATRQYPQCLTCLRRNGDICRFRGIRQFIKDRGSTKLEFGPSFASEIKQIMTHHEAWSPVRRDPPTATVHPHENYLLRITTGALLAQLATEFEHLEQPTQPSFLRNMVGSRQMCDRCHTSIFNGFWLCCVGGCELCYDCYHELVTDSTSGAQLHHDSLAQCHRYVDLRLTYYHLPQQMVPIRRLELDTLWTLREDLGRYQATLGDLPPLPDFAVEQFHPTTADADRQHERPLVRVNYDAITLDQFQSLWRQGEALVVEGLLSRLALDWSPAYWGHHHGQQQVTVVDCTTGLNFPRTYTLAEFFCEFDRPDHAAWEALAADDRQAMPFATLLRSHPRPIPKLKDWPPTEDFKVQFPDHFADFMQALPFPEYTQRDGQLNLASRLPQCFIPPDLGPKMYTAYGSDDGIKGKGTTNLHLDMADAVNLMVHCSPDFHAGADCARQRRGAAVWDIFHADDLPKIRRFLRQHKETRLAMSEDPIHDQSIYLNRELREQLFEAEGVRGWRIYQNPGDAVFVPAGCAHQVCNYTSCIKLAMDFVSPENIRQCRQLTGEFRLLSRSHQRKADLLQLKSILYHAWLDAQAVVTGQLEPWRFQPPPAKPGSDRAATGDAAKSSQSAKRKKSRGTKANRASKGAKLDDA